ncbi:uncharacterized protein TM35_000121560 [Trypanosoma theileri]|uniref:CCHC-type domain-containing protein n=1 Tax=Trypanosoma theileri TaxID=67003 RepID=A0A1X0NXP6_9TRYP|nr:uncharacterized protein TM35_000121560 [Trypanosoma theileri]ORC89381.1 hypothetical protein TM35_000121560 [Trypanosoma theileri]
MINSTSTTYSATEWLICQQAFTAFVRHKGPSTISLECRPNEKSYLQYHIDGLLTLENDVLLVKMAPNKTMKWEELRPSVISFVMPLDEVFLNAFEEACKRLKPEWVAFKKIESPFNQQKPCEEGTQSENKPIQVQINATVSFGEWINQIAQIRQENTEVKTQMKEMQTQLTETQKKLGEMQGELTAALQQLSQQKNIQMTELLKQMGNERLNTNGGEEKSRTNQNTLNNSNNVSHLAWQGGKAPMAFKEGPQLGSQGTQELRLPVWTEVIRPEEKIRSFEGMMDYLKETSPSQLVIAYREIFPMPANPDLAYKDAWDNFVQWTRAIRSDGMSASMIQLGRLIYRQLRIIQTVKDFPGVKMEELHDAIIAFENPNDPFIQYVVKWRERNSTASSTTTTTSNKARCYRCGRIGHYSSTCYVKM